MNEIITRLKKNPIYAMSLGGKELFHSNMLAWLFMNEENQKLKKLFGIKENEVVLNEFREHQNLDLIIVYSSEEVKERIGDISILDDIDSKLSKDLALKFVIIENKFKSIPNKQQLEEYSDKLNKRKYKIYNKYLTNDNTSCYLFAPQIVLDNALGFDRNKGFGESCDINGVTWKAVSYNSFKDKIVVQKGHPCEFILQYYCDMLADLNTILNKKLIDDINEKKLFPNPDNIKLLKQIRFYDIYTKLWYGITQKNIEEDFENNVAFNRKEFGMTRSIGFFEWQIEYEEKLLVGVQIQGNQFRVFVEPYYKKKPKDSKKFKASVNDNLEFKKNICGWGSNIIKKALTAEIDHLNVDEYKYLKFADFKYVKRELDSNMTIEKLVSIVSKALEMLNDKDNIEELYNKISKEIE